jgi:ketosteroid isomerase-like protein
VALSQVTVYLTLLAAALSGSTSFAQGDRFPVQPPPSGAAPRTLDGKPDLSGVWLRPRTVDPGRPEMLPWAVALLRERTEDNLKDAPAARCLPMGVSLLGPILTKFVQTHALLVLIQEAPAGSTIQVFLDGREHPKDQDATWGGHSIGTWEGDTLVVDSVGFNERGWLDAIGRPRTEKLHVVDRIRRPDFGHLEIETTMDDPGTLMRPWTLRRVSDLAPGEEIRELLCNENNLDLAHLVGRADGNHAAEVEETIRNFLVPFSHQDVAAFIDYFAEDATIFFPGNVPRGSGTPSGRVRGRAEIERVFKNLMQAGPSPARAMIQPQDLTIQQVDRIAVATFHLGTDAARSRRTFVLRQVGSDWKIVHLHASSFNVREP